MRERLRFDIEMANLRLRSMTARHRPRTVSGRMQWMLEREDAPEAAAITLADLANKLANLVFFERNPKLSGKPLKAGSKEAAGWSKVRTSEVLPALRSTSALDTICRLIIDARKANQPQLTGADLRSALHDIRHLVASFLALQLKRGKVNSRTIYVIDDDSFRKLPKVSRDRALMEIADAFAFIKSPPMSIVLLEPSRFPEEYNFSDAVVGVGAFAADVHVNQALNEQSKYLNRALTALGSRFQLNRDRLPIGFSEKIGLARSNKQMTPANTGPAIAVPLMASYVSVADLLDFVNGQTLPVGYKDLSKDMSKWTPQYEELFGIALGRAMAHEVRHLYVRTPVHAASGLGSDKPLLFGKDDKFSLADKQSIAERIVALERIQGTHRVAASFGAAERAFDFPF